MTLSKRWARQDDFDQAVYAASRTYGVPVPLLKAVIAVESAFNPSAFNASDPGGAWGLTQVIEPTARALGFTGPMSELFQPVLAINLGAKYLGQQMRRYGEVTDTVAAYNAGSARKAGTSYVNQSYVDRVLPLVTYFQQWEQQKGGAGTSPATFPGGERNLGDTVTGDRGISSDPAPVETARVIPFWAVFVLGALLGFLFGGG